MNIRAKLTLGVGIGVILIVVFLISRFNEFEIQSQQEVPMKFQASGVKLSGSLYLPKSPPPYDVAVFIHGDGPQNRTSNGDYAFIMNALLKNNIACFSFDKAGIGDSEGDWLSQTMEDRAKEIESAMQMLRKETQVNTIGVIGFSQGGWVTSELAKDKTKMDFMVVIGGAIDWMEQHIYYESHIANQKGFTKQEKLAYLKDIRKLDTLIAQNAYEDYVNFVNHMAYGKSMSKERFQFTYLNHEANATDGIKDIQVPFLGLFGENDLNVDAQESYNTYKAIFNDMGKTNYELVMLPNATHELLDAKYNTQREDLTRDALLWGDRIYADGALFTLVDWIQKTVD
ncbi:alpha/beta hydrolase family protein [Virgibacillus dokdonensis]|uniref:Alpha/beta hydrolase n=1 Tax=Virgibacillus dokdonensis TaxID=302167 RepID=A0ABU7VBA4_9BACI|nr:alpha/beta hydrolase [Virgibacillus dokdonensis]